MTIQTHDPDAYIENLLRHWHVTSQFEAAARAQYEALRAQVPLDDGRLYVAYSRWLAADQRKRALTRDIEAAEESDR
jgi:hypothetical protein